MDENLEFLAGVSLFRGFEPAELERLSGYLRQEHYKTGQILIWEGNRQRSLFVLARGRVVVTKVIREEVETVLARVEPGASFGELSLLDGEPAAASVTAEEPSDVHTVSFDDLQALFHEDTQLFGRLAWALAREVSVKLRATNRKVQEAVEWGLDAAALDPHD